MKTSNVQFKTLPAKNLEFLAQVAARFRALGEPNRLRILALLEQRDLSVQEIVEATSLSQPNVSRHLQALGSVGLVERRKAQQRAIYSVRFRQVYDLCRVICRQIEGIASLLGVSTHSGSQNSCTSSRRGR